MMSRKRCGSGRKPARKWLWLFLATVLAAMGPGSVHAVEEDYLSYSDNPFYEGEEVTWEELCVEEGAMFPVYSAPFAESWRAAGGEAAVSSDEAFDLMGTLQGGTWGMVSFEVSEETGRVGWIQLPESAQNSETIQDFRFCRILLEVNRTAEMTDDPLKGRESIRTLQPGERVIGMFSVELNGRRWTYAETETEGKTAWGFVPEEALTQLKTPVHLEGNTLVVEEGVTILGKIEEVTETVTYDEEEELEYLYSSITYLEPGDVAVEYPTYPFEEKKWVIRKVSLPASLRRIGNEGLEGLGLDEVTMTGNITCVASEALRNSRVDRLTLSRDYTAEIPDGTDLVVGIWQVEEENPRYQGRDGVLFSADGKTLLRYPQGKKEVHYDVPAGTETIGTAAFYCGGFNLPLKTMSLPMGLKRIEDWAFSGCGYLISMAVPPTVTELAETAFQNCVSLERLSLPHGFTASLGSGCSETDFSHYVGDNGGVELDPMEDYRNFYGYTVELDTADGIGMVPLYPSAEAAESTGEQAAGTQVRVYGVKGTRVQIGLGWNDPDYWAEISQMRGVAGDVFFVCEYAAPAQEMNRICEIYKTGPDGLVTYDYLTEERVLIPWTEAVLYPEEPTNGQWLGILWSESGVISLSGEGEESGLHVYSETQARVLEEKDGRIRVETAYGTGWTEREHLIPVQAEPCNLGKK